MCEKVVVCERVSVLDEGDRVALCGDGIGGVFFFFFFFFQAEDGIRESVASRGLGDVYKGQLQEYV